MNFSKTLLLTLVLAVLRLSSHAVNADNEDMMPHLLRGAAITKESAIGEQKGKPINNGDSATDGLTKGKDFPHFLTPLTVVVEEDFNRETEKKPSNNNNNVHRSVVNNEVTKVSRRLNAGGGGGGAPPYCSGEGVYCYHRYDCCYGMRCDDPFTTSGTCVVHS